MLPALVKQFYTKSPETKASIQGTSNCLSKGFTEMFIHEKEILHNNTLLKVESHNYQLLEPSQWS